MELNVNKIYLNKSKDYLIAFQKMVLDITFDFMNISQENYDNRVNCLLDNIGGFFGVDRTYLFTLNNKNSTMIYSHEWCKEGVPPLIDIDREIPLGIYPWWLNQLQQNQVVYVEDIDDMPAGANIEQRDLRQQGVKSIVSVPISIDGKLEAYIGIDVVDSTRKWSDEDITLLQMMAKILSRGIAQINHVEQIRFMAHHDRLTGLPNRLLLIEKLNRGIMKAQHEKQSLGILFINLDGFKRINDTLGYHQGDELLKQVADRLLNITNQDEIVYRTDGDQFVLYFSGYETELKLDKIVSKVVAIFNQPFVLKGEEYMITASSGLSQFPQDGEEVEVLLESAYTAMHQAKSLDKNEYLKHSEELRKETQEILLLTNDLYHAIERNEMKIYYQPQVKRETGEIVGVEALLRWKHPILGFISPCRFIPIAEKTRLILPIGYWVLETAAKQIKEWEDQKLKPVKLAVNFSAHQLNHPTIINDIEDILNTTSLAPKNLEIEITETVAIESLESITIVFEKMRSMGINLSIDDYGKQYSSLNRLKEESVNAMKVDMSFIHGIGINPKDEIIIKSILLLASDLGLETVAEGVETEAQVEFLKNTTCDRLQGYYFYKPMPASEMGKLLAKQ